MEVLDIAAALKDALVGLLIILSLALTVIGWISYNRTGNPKIRLVSAAFVLFLLKGLFLAFGMYLSDVVDVPREFAASFDIMLAVDVMVLFTLYMALFRRRRE
ncbi:MAG: hypothetical protein R6V01_07570 [Thermoplasmatota archaeon]